MKKLKGFTLIELIIVMAIFTVYERIGQCGACPSGRAASGAVQCGGDSVGW